MKIGFDSKRAFYNQSGLGNYSRSTIQLLSKHFPSHSYFLYTPSTKKAIKFKLQNNVKIIEPKSYFNRYFKSYWRSFSMSKNIRNDKIDIFHGLSNELPQKIQKTGAKTFVTIHDLIFIRYPEFFKKFDRKIYFQKFKFACETADTIIAISEQTKSDIINYFNINDKKIEVVYQGCNPIFYKNVCTEKKIEVTQKYKLPNKYILYVGTVEERKNSLNIIKAVHKNNIDIPILIVGRKTDYQNKLLEYISKYKLENKVFIHNNIPFVDFPAIYQQAELFIYPSIFEGFGIPIIEALNSKIPVITTKGGCFSESGGMSSIYVEPNNIDEIGNAIKTVIYKPEVSNKMKDDGYKYVQKFREDKIAQNLMNIYIKYTNAN